MKKYEHINHQVLPIMSAIFATHFGRINDFITLPKNLMKTFFLAKEIPRVETKKGLAFTTRRELYIAKLCHLRK